MTTYWFMHYTFSITDLNGTVLGKGEGNRLVAPNVPYLPLRKIFAMLQEDLIGHNKDSKAIITMNNFIQISKEAYDEWGGGETTTPTPYFSLN